jgi:hypothetical protein
MYIAELKGKFSEKGKNKEDVLTSNVFSFFKYADRAIFLKSFLEKLGLGMQISDNDANKAVFEFWPTYDDRTEPDVVVGIGKYYILFEAKYKSDFGKETELHKDQLTRELEGGIKQAANQDKNFRFVAITADYSEPNGKFCDLKEKCKFLWINWHFVTLFLEKKLELETDECLIAKDLYELLKKKGMRKFNGFLSISVKRRVKKNKYLFFDFRSAKYRGKFIGFSEAFSGWDRNNYEASDKIFWEAKHG